MGNPLCCLNTSKSRERDQPTAVHQLSVAPVYLTFTFTLTPVGSSAEPSGVFGLWEETRGPWGSPLTQPEHARSTHTDCRNKQDVDSPQFFVEEE